jgi:hypothetical protein
VDGSCLVTPDKYALFAFSLSEERRRIPYCAFAVHLGLGAEIAAGIIFCEKKIAICRGDLVGCAQFAPRSFRWFIVLKVLFAGLL